MRVGAWVLCLVLVLAPGRLPAQNPDAGSTGEGGAGGGEAADRPADQPFQGIVVYPMEGRLEVNASLAVNYGLLELVGCVRKGKVHESLLMINAQPTDFNLACLAAGLEPPTKPNGLGTTVELLVAWLDKQGQEVLLPIQDLIWNRHAQRTMRVPSWHYLGGTFGRISYYDEKGELAEKDAYIPEFTGTLITLYYDPNAVFAPPPQEGMPEIQPGTPPDQYVGWDDYLAYEPILPERWTQVTLVIRKVPQDSPPGEQASGQAPQPTGTESPDPETRGQ